MRSLTANDKISNRQLCILLIMSMRVGIPGTNLAYLSPYHGGFIITHLTACVAIMLSIIPFFYLAKRFPDRTPYEYSSDLFGKVGGKIFNALMILVFLGIASSEARPIAYLIKTYLLPNTPSWLTIFVMMFTVYYLIRFGINSLGRISEIFIIIAVLCLAVLLIMAVPYIDFSYFNRHIIPPGAGNFFKSSFSVATAFFPLAMLLFFIPFTPISKRMLPSLIISTGIVSIIFITFGVISVSIFGTTLATEMFSPLIELSKIMGSDTSFLPERSGIIFMIIYKTLPQFINCSISIYIASLGLISFFPRMKISACAAISSAAVYIVELIPTNSERIIRTERFWDMVQSSFLPLVIIMLILAIIMKKNKSLSSHVKVGEVL